ncbi:MAG: MFS transporter [Candidatus Nanopelagicaceae bacterium]
MTTFKRDAQFWYIASQLGILGFFMGGFGPAQPLLQSDQGTSGLVAGLHGTSLGFSGLIAGQLNARLVHHFGRFTTSWIGMLTFLAGALGFIVLQPSALTITATALIGFGVTVMINNGVTFLSHNHASNSTVAIAQANGFNSSMYLLGTVAIGTLASLGLSWRLGLLIVFPLALLAYKLSKRHIDEIHEKSEDGRQRGPLGKRYWIGWLGLTFAISAEFSTTFWSAAHLREKFSLSSGNATTAVLCFALGMALGRWYGTLVFPRIDVDVRAFILILIQLFGFLIFWASPMVAASLVGLFLTGLGTSAQFALFSLRLLRFAKDKPDLAIGVSALGAGVAIGCAPFLIGSLSDQKGIATSLLLVPVFILLAGVTLLLRSDVRESA